MSSPHAPSAGSAGKSQLFTFLGSLGAILIFLLILFVAYLPNRPDPVNAQTVEQRLLTLEETRAAGQGKIGNFGVINAAEGVVQIPVERAMELTVRDYAAGGEPAAPGSE